MKTKSSLVLMMLLLAVDANAAINVGTLQTLAVTLSASGGDDGIALSWTVSGDIGSIQVMRDTDANPKGRHRVAILPGDARNYSDNTVENGRQYWYWIKYTDTKRNIGNSNAGRAIANSDGGRQNFTLTGVTVTSANAAVTVGSTASDDTQTLVHLGLLHSQGDFDRLHVQVALDASPWKEDWEKLIKNPHSDYGPNGGGYDQIGYGKLTATLGH